MNAEQPENKHRSVTDEELAKLLDPDLHESERERILARLGDDPDSVHALALAMKSEPSQDGFTPAEVDSILKLVKVPKSDAGICPNCAGDLHEGGIYCPHCGLQVGGNTIKCFSCGSLVREGSAYCPECGAFFREMEAGGRASLPIFLLVGGLVLIVIAAIMWGVSLPAAAVLLGIGCILSAIWLGIYLERFRKSKRGVEQREVPEIEDTKESERKSG